jgi:putative transposase
MALHTERYRVDHNIVRPHEALSWNRPHDVDLGLAAQGPQLSRARNLPTA